MAEIPDTSQKVDWILQSTIDWVFVPTEYFIILNFWCYHPIQRKKFLFTEKFLNDKIFSKKSLNLGEKIEKEAKKNFNLFFKIKQHFLNLNLNLFACTINTLLCMHINFYGKRMCLTIKILIFKNAKFITEHLLITNIKSED